MKRWREPPCILLMFAGGLGCQAGPELGRGGCPGRSAGGAAQPGCSGPACLLAHAKSCGALALVTQLGLSGPGQQSPQHRRCVMRTRQLGAFAQFHNTDTPTEQLGCVILRFTDPFLSLPSDLLLAAAYNGSLWSCSMRC